MLQWGGASNEPATTPFSMGFFASWFLLPGYGESRSLILLALSGMPKDHPKDLVRHDVEEENLRLGKSWQFLKVLRRDDVEESCRKYLLRRLSLRVQ